MRMLREAAVVAAMVGGLGMVGAGVTTAYAAQPVSISCEQDSSETVGGTTSSLSQTGDQNLAGGLSSGGDASTNANQNVCGIGNDGNTNESGNAVGGAGGTGTISVNDEGLLEAIIDLLGGIIVTP